MTSENVEIADISGAEAKAAAVHAAAQASPTGWRVLIDPTSIKTESEGGIRLAEQTIELLKHARYTGKVLAMGPLCYKDEAKFGDGAEPWCKVGDTVAFGMHAGQRLYLRDPVLKENGRPAIQEFRLINDDEILAVIHDPDAVDLGA